MILSAQSIRARIGIEPFCTRQTEFGMSYGLSSAGYDIRIKLAGDSKVLIVRPAQFFIATTIEYIAIPNDILGMLKDKSSWARQGLSIFNTVFEPGWRGYPTIELVNNSNGFITIYDGAPIGQMIFHQLDMETEIPYSGKYQNQPQLAVSAIHEVHK